MALTHNGSRVDLPAANLPDGYAKPAISVFSDYEGQHLNVEFSFTKASVENSDESTTMANILTELNSQIETYLTADLNTAGATITSYALLKSLRLNVKPDEVLYTDGTINFVAVVDIYYKTA